MAGGQGLNTLTVGIRGLNLRAECSMTMSEQKKFRGVPNEIQAVIEVSGRSGGTVHRRGARPGQRDAARQSGGRLGLHGSTGFPGHEQGGYLHWHRELHE